MSLVVNGRVFFDTPKLHCSPSHCSCFGSPSQLLIPGLAHTNGRTVYIRVLRGKPSNRRRELGGRYTSESVCVSFTNILIISINIPLKPCTKSCVCGWYAVPYHFLMPSVRYSDLVSSDGKLVPRSLSRRSETPCRQMTLFIITLTKAILTSDATANASAHHVK